MANFKNAEGVTGKSEGLYANNPADNGGETYAGIARNFWPKWEGWTIIDDIKANGAITASQINAKAKANTKLTELISSFYKANFWDANKLDLFNDQQVANTVYDFGVNAGTRKAAKTLQEVLNVAIDGIIGNITVGQVNAGNPKAIHTAFNCKRKEYYEYLATKPNQKQFLKSWLSRLKPYV
jgi:lysozyme family protein